MPKLEDIAKEKKKFEKKDYRSYDLDAKTSPSTAPISPAGQQVKISKSGLGEIIEIEPSLCKPWSYADRSNSEMGNIEELANSIKSNGQQEPALVRTIKDNKKIKYEVIFGHRRWMACKLCNKPLIAMVKNLDDIQAAIAQKEENENRENLSDYSRAFNYKKLLEDKVFSSASELAANFNISKTTLSDLLSYTKLPEKLIQAFKEPHLLPKRTAIRLVQLCNAISDENLDVLCSLAPLILSGKIPYNRLTTKLFSSMEENNEKRKNTQFKNDLSIKLFTSGANQNKAPCFTFHKVVTDNNLIPELEDIVFKFLKEKTEKGSS